MRFIWRITLSRMLREKKRLLFVLLAIAASSCLIVWTIGGFQALFIDASTQEADYLGHYDLRIARSTSDMGMTRRGGGGAAFDGPLSRGKKPPTDAVDDKSKEKKKIVPDNLRPVAPTNNGLRNGGGRGMALDLARNDDGLVELAKLHENVPEQLRSRLTAADVNGDGILDTEEEKALPTPRNMARNGGPGMRGGQNLVFPDSLVATIRADETVAICDESSTLRMFIYSPGSVASILEDEDADDEGDKPTLKRSLDLSDDELAEIGEAPEGIDPELHRRAMGAYRATMGTPMGMGATFQATTAREAPYELSDGRWFSAKKENGSYPREAVMTTRGNKKYRAKVGDSILLMDKSSLIGATTEYQLKVVGIVEDEETDGFYISRSLAEEISTNANVATSALFIKLRGNADEFRNRLAKKIEAEVPDAEIITEEELTAQKAAAFKESQSFKYQAASGTLLAALAALLIVFTALNMSVDEQKRLIAFYRVAGLTRSQVGASVLIEALLLAAPGWLAGLASGWGLVLICSGKTTGLNFQTIGFSFICTFIGAVLAALYPIFQSARVKPLDAINQPEKHFIIGAARRRQTKRFLLAAIGGLACTCADLYLVYNLPGDASAKAALHSGLGVLLLAVGVVGCLPIVIRVAEAILLPILAWFFRFDRLMLGHEFSGNASRVLAVAVALSVGGGLFVTMQIWGYSMLDPFLPGRRAPDAFAAFLPNGLRPEIIEDVKNLPMVDSSSFLPVAVEQAAFAEGSVPEDARKSQFANVVFFGVDVAKAFEGQTPFVGVRFRQGDPAQAWQAMKAGRGVVVTDSLSVDYKLNYGDVLKVIHPREPDKTLEYPIVGVVSFPGWQWLSKTGGVRRNFGRSGGIAFAREGIVANDFQIERRSYFWFNSKDGKPLDYQETELACDFLARKNLRLDLADEKNQDHSNDASRTAYVKLSTRESLTTSISRRADSVIWGLSKTPLTTLIVASIAVVGAIANSVRARRWQYGVMRAVGVTRWALIRAILAEAILIGLVASFASFAFGFLAAQGALKLGQSMFGTVDPPLILPIKGLLIGLSVTVSLCLIAALYPAIKTGRAEPLKLLQSGRSLE